MVTENRMLSPGTTVESVHSQRKLMILIEPEQNYWLHLSLNLPQSDTKASTSVMLPQFESALRHSFKMAYDDFKLVNGSFAHLLEDRGQDEVKALLVVHFGKWAREYPGDSVQEFQSGQSDELPSCGT